MHMQQEIRRLAFVRGSVVVDWESHKLALPMAAAQLLLAGGRRACRVGQAWYTFSYCAHCLQRLRDAPSPRSYLRVKSKQSLAPGSGAHLCLGIGFCQSRLLIGPGGIDTCVEHSGPQNGVVQGLPMVLETSQSPSVFPHLIQLVHGDGAPLPCQLCNGFSHLTMHRRSDLLRQYAGRFQILCQSHVASQSDSFH